MPSASLPRVVGQRRMDVGEFLGPVPDGGREQQFPARRRPQATLGRADAALVGDLEVADLLDRVAEELDPQRVLLGGREHVHDAAAHGDLAAAADHVGPRVADLDQPGEQVVEFARLAGPQRDRLEVAEPGHDRLQQAPDRRHDDRQRAVRLTGGRRVGEPPQHGEPLPDRVRARRQPLVRQGLPAGEARHAVRGQERAEPGRQVLGLPGRGRDGEHESRGALPLCIGLLRARRLRAGPAAPGQRGRQHRAQRRRRHQVDAGRARAGRAGAGRLWAGRRARDHGAELRVVVENAEQSCEAHDVLVIAVRPSTWLPLASDGTGRGQHEPAGSRQTRLSVEHFKFTRFAAPARVRTMRCCT